MGSTTNAITRGGHDASPRDEKEIELAILASRAEISKTLEALHGRLNPRVIKEELLQQRAFSDEQARLREMMAQKGLLEHEFSLIRLRLQRSREAGEAVNIDDLLGLPPETRPPATAAPGAPGPGRRHRPPDRACALRPVAAAAPEEAQAAAQGPDRLAGERADPGRAGVGVRPAAGPARRRRQADGIPARGPSPFSCQAAPSVRRWRRGTGSGASASRRPPRCARRTPPCTGRR